MLGPSLFIYIFKDTLMIAKRSDLSWIMVSDIKKAKKFFTEVLGLEVRTDNSEYNWLELMPKDGGAMLGIGQANADSDCGKDVLPGSNAIVTFTVDNLEATKAEFEKKGVNILGDIMEVPGHVKMLLFSDLDGNKFQVCELLDCK